MHCQLEKACKTYSTECSSGLIEFDSYWQRIFITALTFHLDQATYDPCLELFGLFHNIEAAMQQTNPLNAQNCTAPHPFKI